MLFRSGGNGGGGVVVIKYTGTRKASGGDYIDTSSPSQTIHVFKGTASFITNADFQATTTNYLIN